METIISILGIHMDTLPGLHLFRKGDKISRFHDVEQKVVDYKVSNAWLSLTKDSDTTAYIVELKRIK